MLFVYHDVLGRSFWIVQDLGTSAVDMKDPVQLSLLVKLHFIHQPNHRSFHQFMTVKLMIIILHMFSEDAGNASTTKYFT